MSDPFVFCDEGETDEGLRYGPGGLCPVKLGDIIGPDGSTAPPRYRISAKLGYGAFATVWLAHDAVKRRVD